MRFPSYTAGGERLVASATSGSFAGTQIVTFGEDGGDLRCLTCGVWTGPELLKPFAFADGRRLLVRVGVQTPVQPAGHAVVECAPSVLRCDSVAVTPVAVPASSEPGVQQDQREMRIAPDGEHVAFTQVRNTPGGRSDGVGVVGRLVRGDSGYTIEDARVVASGGELKNFTADGQGILFARFTGAVRGRRTPTTSSSTCARDTSRAPPPPSTGTRTSTRRRARRAAAAGTSTGSARGTRLLETVSQVRRPTYIDAGIRALPFVVFAARNAEIAEPWLADEHDARGRYLGQPLAPGAVARGWDSKPNFTWKPDGTAIVFWQQRRGATRAVVARLTARRAQAPPPVRPSPTPAWATPLAGYVPRDPDGPRRTFKRRGRAGGTVTVRRAQSGVTGYQELIVVRYRALRRPARVRARRRGARRLRALRDVRRPGDLQRGHSRLRPPPRISAGARRAHRPGAARKDPLARRRAAARARPAQPLISARLRGRRARVDRRPVFTVAVCVAASYATALTRRPATVTRAGRRASPAKRSS